MNKFRNRFSPLPTLLAAACLMFLSMLAFSCSDADDDSGPPTVTGYSVEGALVGTQITINGKNFGKSIDNVTVEFFDEAAATISSLTPTSITVTVPDDAYVGNVMVTVKGKTVEGPIFYVLTMCSVDGLGIIPCNRVKNG